MKAYATTADLAVEFRCTRKHVLTLAKRHGVGMNLGGRGGYRFNDDDVKALRAALAPKVTRQSRRRSA